MVAWHGFARGFVPHVWTSVGETRAQTQASPSQHRRPCKYAMAGRGDRILPDPPSPRQCISVVST